MLLLVTFGLFLAHTLGRQGPARAQPAAGDPGANSITVFTDLPGESDAPMGIGTGAGIGVMLFVAILCGLIMLVLAAMVVKRCRREHYSRYDFPGGTASPPRGPPARAFGLTIADLSVPQN